MSSVHAFLRQIVAEGWKVRRTPLTRLPWILPLIFLLVDLLVFQRPFLHLRILTPEASARFDRLPLDLPLALWGGFIHPLVLALLPALACRPEHMGGTWRHAHCLPASSSGAFLAKAIQVLAQLSLMLITLGCLLALERWFLAVLNPALARPFPGLRLAIALAWLGLASLPMLAMALWIAHRMSGVGVPAMLGLTGLLLTASLSGQELAQPWKRDLMPWMLPYAAMERALREGTIQQSPHPAARSFQPVVHVLQLPNGRRVRVWQNLPDEVLFPPPEPTPVGLLAGCSLGLGLLLLMLGALDARRPPL